MPETPLLRRRRVRGGDDAADAPKFERVAKYLQEVHTKFAGKTAAKSFPEMLKILGAPSDFATQAAIDFAKRAHISHLSSWAPAYHTFPLLAAYLAVAKPEMLTVDHLHDVWVFSNLWSYFPGTGLGVTSERRHEDARELIKIEDEETFKKALKPPSKPAEGARPVQQQFQLPPFGGAEVGPVLNGWRLRMLVPFAELPDAVKERNAESQRNVAPAVRAIEHMAVIVEAVRGKSIADLEAPPAPAPTAQEGGAKAAAAPRPRRTAKHVKLAGREAVVYEGPRGGEYVLWKGKFVTVARAKAAADAKAAKAAADAKAAKAKTDAKAAKAKTDAKAAKAKTDAKKKKAAKPEPRMTWW